LNLAGMKPWPLSPYPISILIKLSQLQVDSVYIPKLHRICIFLYSDLFFQHLFSFALLLVLHGSYINLANRNSSLKRKLVSLSSLGVDIFC
jgi:hypothetical protein